MRLKIVLTHVAAAAALVLAGAVGYATAADDASTKRRDGSVPEVVVFYEDGSGRLDDGRSVCAVGWPCDEQPYCPEEDSCALDYSGGKWTVREIVP